MAPSTTTGNLATARRRQDGPRRVSFSETRLTSTRLYDSDDDDERMRGEEEEERSLSERFGEAAESNEGEGKKRKREESEKDIAQELDQEEKKKIKKIRPRLTEANLTDANGLIKLPIEMKRIKYKPRKGKKRDMVAAGAYCKKLMNAYRSFCADLMPSMNFEDVLLKIQQLGIKKDVKNFLQNTRDSVRAEHLERFYGREKAEKMLSELNEGMKQQSQEDFTPSMQDLLAADNAHQEEEAENTNTAPSEDGTGNSVSNASSGAPVSTTTAGPTLDGDVSDGEERSQDSVNHDDYEDKAADSNLKPENENMQVEPKDTAKEVDDEDDEEEEEATFDDVMEVERPTSSSNGESKEEESPESPRLSKEDSETEPGQAAAAAEDNGPNDDLADDKTVPEVTSEMQTEAEGNGTKEIVEATSPIPATKVSPAKKTEEEGVLEKQDDGNDAVPSDEVVTSVPEEKHVDEAEKDTSKGNPEGENSQKSASDDVVEST